MDAVRRIKWLARIAADSLVTETALRVAIVLADHKNHSSGRCDPAMSRLVDRTGKSESSVRRAIQMLGRSGYLSIEQSRGGSQEATNQYNFLTPVTSDTPTPVTHDTPGGNEGVSPVRGVMGDRGVTGDCQGVSPVTAEGCHSFDTQTGNRTGNRTGITATANAVGGNVVAVEVAGKKCGEGYKTKKGRVLAGEQLTWFEEFWKAFDLKKGKADAADTWLALRVDEALKDDIISGAKREARSRTKPGEQGPNPKWAQGWLSGRRWEDEPEGGTGGTGRQGHDWLSEVGL